MKVIFDIDELITQLTDVSSVITLIEDPLVLDYLAHEYTKYYVENNNNEADFEIVDCVARNGCTHAVTLDFLAQKIKEIEKECHLI